MDIIASTASVAQLVAYSHSAVQKLFRLHQAVRNGPTSYSDQKTNISILLHIVRRISRQGILQEELVLPILVEISAIACRIECLLNQKGIFGYHWTSLGSCKTLSEAFFSLNTKRDLLHLCISGENQETLDQVRLDIAQMSANLPDSGKGTVEKVADSGKRTAEKVTDSCKKTAKKISEGGKRAVKKTPKGCGTSTSATTSPTRGAVIKAKDTKASNSGNLSVGCGYGNPPDIDLDGTSADGGISTIGDRYAANPEDGATRNP
ncbi:MAG: hypothetical protein M1821_010006 [Bathelium mastoideum]|nr:MAG: hypothetical protein M1821_010006 [Bathelium mastoideum]KAI9690223.1 MAG: hypothetical protein M1822_009184 [Bathelium mastoideum]